MTGTIVLRDNAVIANCLTGLIFSALAKATYRSGERARSTAIYVGDFGVFPGSAVFFKIFRIFAF
jgi:hypothetical protein